jgi:hypothetical protein
VSGRERDVGLRDRQPHLVGSGHDRRLGDRRMLDQHRFQFERADLVVTRLEDVIGPADVRDVAVVVPTRDITVW